MAKQRKWQFGDPIPNTRCPECGGPIVYNGNYYCADYNNGDCKWALPHPTLRDEDHLAFQVAYTELMHMRGEEPDVEALNSRY